jgi:hypothetical protein
MSHRFAFDGRRSDTGMAQDHDERYDKGAYHQQLFPFDVQSAD